MSFRTDVQPELEPPSPSSRVSNTRIEGEEAVDTSVSCSLARVVFSLFQVFRMSIRVYPIVPAVYTGIPSRGQVRRIRTRHILADFLPCGGGEGGKGVASVTSPAHLHDHRPGASALTLSMKK